MGEIEKFFAKKRPWSKYKDLILGYYLKPYLDTVAKIGKPIAVVDCFAGPGRFDDGEPGSPLIILSKLRDLHARGVPVQAVFIEKHKQLYDALERNIPQEAFPISKHNDDFQNRVDLIAEIAKTHTLFVYLDPISPSHLRFGDMESVYRKLSQGNSVEVLINFLSPSFLRGAQGVLSQIMNEEIVVEGQTIIESPTSTNLDSIVGGKYWRPIAEDSGMSQQQKVEKIAEEYSEKLGRWFKYRIRYPIKESYSDRLPKYHLVFGSRHHRAIDYMNDAMVNARREFLGSEFPAGLFGDNTPKKELPDPIKARQDILDASRKVGKTTWNILRIHAAILNPARYTESEYNRAIKEVIKGGQLCSDATGEKIDEKAQVWLPVQSSR